MVERGVTRLAAGPQGRRRAGAAATGRNRHPGAGRIRRAKALELLSMQPRRAPMSCCSQAPLWRGTARLWPMICAMRWSDLSYQSRPRRPPGPDSARPMKACRSPKRRAAPMPAPGQATPNSSSAAPTTSPRQAALSVLAAILAFRSIRAGRSRTRFVPPKPASKPGKQTCAATEIGDFQPGRRGLYGRDPWRGDCRAQPQECRGASGQSSGDQ